MAGITSQLHLPELTAYMVVYIGSIVYSLISFNRTTSEYLPQVDIEHDFETDCLLPWSCGRLRDVTDLEWQVAKRFVLHWHIFILLGHSVGFGITKLVAPQHLAFFVIVYTSTCLFILMSSSMVLLVVANALFAILLPYYCRHLRTAHQTILYYTLFLVAIITISLFEFDTDPERNLLVQVSLGWLNAKCLSYWMDLLWADSSHLCPEASSPFAGLAYLFYMPPFFFGPIYQYSHFVNALNTLTTKSNQMNGRSIGVKLFCLIRFIFWAVILETLLHYLYPSVFLFYPHLVGRFNTWSLAGFGFSLMILFFVKYFILYGLPMAIAEIDGLTGVLPSPPQCIAHMHQTSYLWRKFDQGLYHFLVKYFYKPITGTKHTNPQRKLVAGVVCFAIISIWHGFYGAVILWVIINFFLSALEIVAPIVRERSFLCKIEARMSPANQSRMEVLLAEVPYLAVAYLSNIFFLSNIECGLVISNKLLLGFPWPMLSTWLVLYCSCHVCAHINRHLL